MTAVVIHAIYFEQQC